ncbi:protein argonaute 2 [Syzygium oleosum]|uniref:protein argonaute 2 n=1 Tax=Syzygium oleosum TaxID=219896 RepID=UPI0024BAD88A|nr:protein argonaute 2 [Syzygium oleosum]
METGGENLIGITRGKRETRIGIIVMAIPIVNETTDVQGVVVVGKGTLPENLIGELGVGHQLIRTLVILDMMPHYLRAVSVQPEFNLVSRGNGDKICPVRRPDKGGSLAARHVRILVNNFPITFNPEIIIRHYDVDIKPEAPARRGHPVRLSKATLSQIKEKLFSDNRMQFPLSMTAYDGEKNIFSAILLPCGMYNVKILSTEYNEESSFQCTITLVNELKLRKLKDYLAGNLLSIPRDILQGMDLVMKENPARHMISVGRHFYPLEYHEADDLKCGIAAFRGFQHSLKPTSQGLALSLDYSVIAFRKRMLVIDFLKEHIRGFNIGQFARYRREVEQALKGVKVTMTHRKTKQNYTFVRLTKETTRSISFNCKSSEGKMKKINLVNYFSEKYKIEIKYKDIPCLDFSKNNKKNYVPMEFCVLVEGQSYPKENLDRDAAFVLKKLSLPPPHIRKKSICDMIRSNNGPCGDVSQNFGIKVDMNMTKVVGRVIKPPELKLGTSNGKMIKIEVDKDKCHWNLIGKSVVDGKRIERWVIIDFSALDRNRLNCKLFIQKLIGRCRNLGIRMEEPLFYQDATMSMFSNVARLTELLENVNDRACRVGRWRPQFLLCIMSRRDIGYKHLKWICETQVGLVTQCCLSGHANKANDQYLANLALKINAKLGGSNVELFNRFPHIDGEGHVMFIGADVNHPTSRNTTSPSFAAVVGTVNWPAANRYAARVRPQLHRQEKIVNIGDMCLELVETYAHLNRVRPGKLVLFRDGVSESQFDMVLNEELQDLKKAFTGKDYRPTITIIVAQKRHQTRLFPERDVDGGPTGNVPPGTVVDTTVVHPFEFDFYLCSHYGGLGTSKPTHYHVLLDEHKFSSDHLEKLIYSLCFMFARCTKPVSLVTPVYYADLAAYRGRLYHEAMMEHSPSSMASSFSSMASSSFSSLGLNEERFCKLHADVENMMFFI